MRVAGGGDEAISLDYAVIDGHWVIVHGTFSQTMHVAFLTFKVIADMTFSDIAFPTEPPDPRLAGTPTPTTSPYLRGRHALAVSLMRVAARNRRA